jgi:hypothetical protein
MNFEKILAQFTTAVENADYDSFGDLFAEDGVYHDGFYGAFEGRVAIVDMLRVHFHGAGKSYRWVMEDVLCQGEMGYARYIFSYDATMEGHEGQHVVFEGMSQFTFIDGKIACYREVFDKGMALSQLNFPAERIKKSLTRWSGELLRSERGKRM